MITVTTAALVLAIASAHKDDNDSSRLCYRDAKSLYYNGQYYYAAHRAISALRYAVGIFHADYQRAAEKVEA